MLRTPSRRAHGGSLHARLSLQLRHHPRLLLCALLSLLSLLLLFLATDTHRLPFASSDSASLLPLPAHCVPEPLSRAERSAAARTRVQKAAGGGGVRDRRFLLVSTWPPTKCGIASYSSGLRQGLLQGGAAAVDVVAVHLRSARPTQYGAEVRAPFSFWEDLKLKDIYSEFGRRWCSR